MINRSTVKAALEATPNCLSLGDLERLAENPSEKHPHVTECPRCQTELALLKEFEANAPLPDEGAAVAWISSHLDRRLEQIKNPKASLSEKDSSRRLSWLAALFGSGNARWLVPIAAVVVIGAVSAILLRSSKQPELRADIGKSAPIYRSQEVQVIAPVGELAQPPQNLQWKAFSGAETYKVSIMEVDHVALWSGQTKDISMTIPNATRAKMLPGKPVLWQVTALDSQGRTLAVSQVERFSVTRKTPSSNRGLSPR